MAESKSEAVVLNLELTDWIHRKLISMTQNNKTFQWNKSGASVTLLIFPVQGIDPCIWAVFKIINFYFHTIFNSIIIRFYFKG